MHIYISMKFRTVFLTSIALLLAISCVRKEEVKPEIIIPTESQAAFASGISFDSGEAAQPGQQPKIQTSIIKFTATGKWTASVTDVTKASSWVSVEPTSGDAGDVTLTVTTQPNTEQKERSATVTITCGTDSDSFTVTQAAATPQTVAVTSVTLDKTTLELIIGSSETLTATVAPDNATDKTVSWSTSDEKVATVDQNGKITAVSVGNATVTAKAGDKEATCAVTVKDNFIAVTEITINEKELPMTVGDTFTLTATVKPDDATDPTVTWSSSDETVATVDAKGIVKAVGAGNATITAKAGDKEATCAVTVSEKVIPVAEVTINMKELPMTVGEYFTLGATVKPDDATDPTVTWSSSDESIATVSEIGTVHAVGAGQATITAKAGDKEATCTVIVSEKVIPVTEVTVNVKNLPMTVGEYFTLGATVKPDDATNPTVTWSSSDESVATVTEIGTVHAVGAGQARITARAGDKEDYCNVTVSENVIAVTEVTLNMTELPMSLGDTFTLTATVKPDDATDPTVTWSSYNVEVATVDEKGTVKAIGIGNALIGAKAGDKEATCLVTVTDAAVEVTSITLDQTSVSMTEGQTLSLKATVSPDNASDKTVVWESSNTKVATVKDGTVTAVAEGSAKITAKAGGKTATCIVTVAKYVFSIDQTSIEVSGNGEEFSIGFVCTGDYEITLPEWITLDLDYNSRLFFTAGRNPGDSERSGDIVIKDKRGNSLKCTVKQGKRIPDEAEGGNEDVEDGEDINW